MYRYEIHKTLGFYKSERIDLCVLDRRLTNVYKTNLLKCEKQIGFLQFKEQNVSNGLKMS